MYIVFIFYYDVECLTSLVLILSKKSVLICKNTKKLFVIYNSGLQTEVHRATFCAHSVFSFGK